MTKKMSLLTEEQVRLMREAMGDGSTFPKMTSDPVVNYEIDRELDDEFDVPWDELSNEMQQDYIEEAEMMKELFNGK